MPSRGEASVQLARSLLGRQLEVGRERHPDATAVALDRPDCRMARENGVRTELVRRADQHRPFSACLELLDRALDDDTPTVDDRDRVTDLLDLVEMM